MECVQVALNANGIQELQLMERSEDILRKKDFNLVVNYSQINIIEFY